MAGSPPSATGWDWLEALLLTNFGISPESGAARTANTPRLVLSVAFHVFVSPPFLLLLLTVCRITVAQKQDGGCQMGHRWLQVCTVQGLGFPNTVSSAWFNHCTVQYQSSGFFWTLCLSPRRRLQDQSQSGS